MTHVSSCRSRISSRFARFTRFKVHQRRAVGLMPAARRFLNLNNSSGLLNRLKTNPLVSRRRCHGREPSSSPWSRATSAPSSCPTRSLLMVPSRGRGSGDAELIPAYKTAAKPERRRHKASSASCRLARRLLMAAALEALAAAAAHLHAPRLLLIF